MKLMERSAYSEAGGMKKYNTTPRQAAHKVAKNLKETGFEVKDIRSIEADIAWLREKGLV